MATVNLNKEGTSTSYGNSGIIVRDNQRSIPGGKTLDVTGFGPAVTNGVGTFGAITAGSTYTNGTYANVPLTGGTGTGATADITVAGGVVTTVTKRNPGKNYTAGDSLSATAASIGGTGTGFAVAVATVANVPEIVVIPEGHVIIRETATGEFKPMPLSGATYTALPSGHTYAGINVAEILKADPRAGISYECTVNRKASVYDPTPIEAAIKAALPNIHFLED